MARGYFRAKMFRHEIREPVLFLFFQSMLFWTIIDEQNILERDRLFRVHRFLEEELKSLDCFVGFHVGLGVRALIYHIIIPKRMPVISCKRKEARAFINRFYHIFRKLYRICHTRIGINNNRFQFAGFFCLQEGENHGV